METKYKAPACTFLNMYNQGTFIIFGLYILFVSRDWFGIAFFMYLLGLVAFAITFMLPEAPRWLLVNGRTTDALEQFKAIAEANGVEYTISSDV